MIVGLQTTPKDKRAAIVSHAKADDFMRQLMDHLAGRMAPAAGPRPPRWELPAYERRDSVRFGYLQARLVGQVDGCSVTFYLTSPDAGREAEKDGGDRGGESRLPLLAGTWPVPVVKACEVSFPDGELKPIRLPTGKGGTKLSATRRVNVARLAGRKLRTTWALTLVDAAAVTVRSTDWDSADDLAERGLDGVKYAPGGKSIEWAFERALHSPPDLRPVANLYATLGMVTQVVDRNPPSGAEAGPGGAEVRQQGLKRKPESAPSVGGGGGAGAPGRRGVLQGAQAMTTHPFGPRSSHGSRHVT